MSIRTILHYTTDHNLQNPDSNIRPTLKDKLRQKDFITFEATDIHVIEEVATYCKNLGFKFDLSENSVKNIWYSGDPYIKEKCGKTIEMA